LGCTLDTGKPTKDMVKEFQANLGIGSYLFSVKRMDNGSQSKEATPFIYRVVDIKGDYVFAQPIFAKEGRRVSMQEYRQLLADIGKEKILPLTFAGEEPHSDGFDDERRALVDFRKNNTDVRYYHRCNVFYLKVFSKSALLDKGSLEYYSHDWTPDVTMKSFGYVTKLTSAGSPPLICQEYGNSWLPESLQGLPMP
jgi:hypothetical protein